MTETVAGQERKRIGESESPNVSGQSENHSGAAGAKKSSFGRKTHVMRLKWQLWLSKGWYHGLLSLVPTGSGALFFWRCTHGLQPDP